MAESDSAFAASAVTYDSMNDVTLVTDSPHEMYIGWTVLGDLYPTTVEGVSGSDWVFAGDQTANFTVLAAYPMVAPDLTPAATTGGEWTSSPALASKPVAGFGSQAMGGGDDYQHGLTRFVPADAVRPQGRALCAP